MIIKLINPAISSDFSFEEKIKTNLLEYRKTEDLNYLYNDNSLLSHHYITVEVIASANFFLNLNFNKNLNITFDYQIFGLESFNILINEKYNKLTPPELEVIKKYVIDGFEMHNFLLKKEPTNYSIANILPLCTLKKALISTSLKNWIELIQLINIQPSEEFLEFKLFSAKIKNFIIDLCPTLSQIFKFEREVEYNFLMPEDPTPNEGDKTLPFPEDLDLLGILENAHTPKRSSNFFGKPVD